MESVLYSWGILMLFEAPPQHCTDYIKSTITKDTGLKAVIEHTEEHNAYIEDKADLDVILGPPT